MQSEQHLRHQYLEVLGISSWLPRGVLPGAAKSDAWVAEFVYTDAEVQEPINTLPLTSEKPLGGRQSKVTAGLSDNASGERPKRLPASTQDSMAVSLAASENRHNAVHLALETLSHLPAVTPVKPAVKSFEQDSQGSDTLSSTVIPGYTPSAQRSLKKAPIMRLMFWQYQDILVIDSLPTQTRGTLSSPKYEQLITNMLLAMQLDAQRIDAQSQPYVLNWPTLAGISIDQGWEQAVSAVQHKVAKILKISRPKIVLMLGEPAAQMVMGLEDDFDAMCGIVFNFRSDIKSMTTYSLTEMLNIPGCKRDVWMDLQKIMQS